MSRWEILLVAGMTAVTFGVRYPVLALVSRMELRLRLSMRYASSCLPCWPRITALALFMPAGTLDLSPGNAYLIAGVAAALIAWRTRNLLLTIVLGMAVFWLWRVLL
ncbi:MAG: AzlD domain-containing protein [Caldilineaceae bacterium]